MSVIARDMNRFPGIRPSGVTFSIDRLVDQLFAFIEQSLYVCAFDREGRFQIRRFLYYVEFEILLAMPCEQGLEFIVGVDRSSKPAFPK